MAVPLALKQLTREPLRLLVALLGVGFAVLLMLMQLGFRSAMVESAVRYQERLDYDLVLLSPKMVFIGISHPFPRRRLYQAAAREEVTGVTPVYVNQQHFENPWTHGSRNLLVVGIDPAHQVLRTPGASEHLSRLQSPDVVLFDALSRPEFGPVAEGLGRGERVFTELGDRRVEVVGLFELGSSFGIDGSVLTSDLNFLRLFPQRRPGAIDLGLIRLRDGASPEAVQRALMDGLPDDVEVLTREGFRSREASYWEGTTPVGYVFGFGLVMGLVVGGIIVYQILFADVSDHLKEYATLKAMGYTDAALAGVVLREAVVLAVLGFFPGALLARLGYAFASAAIRMPLELTWSRAGAVLALTVAMCSGAALMALRKLADADPADVF